MTMQPIIRVTRLTLDSNGQRDPRRFRLKDVTFNVAHGEFLLIVGGAAAGKSSLIDALDRGNSATFRPSSVWYAEGITPRRVNSSAELPSPVSQAEVVLKDGFQMEKLDHWQLLNAVRSSRATLISATEIHRLVDWRPEFTRVMFLLAGRIVVDGSPNAAKEQIAACDLSGLRQDDRRVLTDWKP